MAVRPLGGAFVKYGGGQPNLCTGDFMFSPLDILLGAAGVLVALGISAPFLWLRRPRPAGVARTAPVPAPAPAQVAGELQNVS
jgi:hypothetical protein